MNTAHELFALGVVLAGAYLMLSKPGAVLAASEVTTEDGTEGTVLDLGGIVQQVGNAFSSGPAQTMGITRATQSATAI
jgi:hypothetical protein